MVCNNAMMMSLSVLGASLLLLAVQPSAPSPLAGLQDSPTPDPDIIPPSENCTNSSARSNPEKKLAALDSVGKHILLKLNLTEPPGAAATAGDLTESMIADFHAQVDALQQVGAEECHGRESTHFSRQLMLYFPDLFKAEDPPTYQPESVTVNPDSDDKEDKDVKESNKKDDKAPDSGAKSSENLVKPPSLPPVLYNLRFDGLNFSEYNRLWSVQLQLYKRKITLPSADENHFRRGINPIENVKVYQVLRRLVAGQLEKRYILLASENFASDTDEFISFNITAGIKKWMERSPHATGLELDVHVDTPERVDTGLPLPPVINFEVPSFRKGDHDARLYVEKLSENERLPAPYNNKTRRKRQTVEGVNNEYCFVHPKETNCCIRELSVHFHDDLGWDFIRYPTSFTPNYCNGGCSTDWPSATDSTTLLMQLRESNPTAAPEPCCIAHKTKSLFVLAEINNVTALHEIPDMIVESCICR